MYGWCPLSTHLPPKEAPALKQADFKYHQWFDWDRITADLGFPVVIKPAGGWEAIGVNIAHNLDELIHYYNFDPEFLSPEVGKKVVDSCKIINRALGYAINSVEFFIDEAGNAQAIDFNNPVPDGRRHALGPVFYEDYQQAAVELITDVVVTHATHLPSTQAPGSF
jgi:hypothetical protein